MLFFYLYILGFFFNLLQPTERENIFLCTKILFKIHFNLINSFFKTPYVQGFLKF